MLTVETIGRIRREHFIKGKTIKEIARDLKVSRNTVRRVGGGGGGGCFGSGLNVSFVLEGCRTRPQHPTNRRPGHL